MKNIKQAWGNAPWPVLFLGHGSPMNAMKNNGYSKAWRSIGKQLGKPKSVLCVSAHWLTEGTQITSNEKPKTIHDFGGFPEELFQVQYPAPGDPSLAKHTAALLGVGEKALAEEWGLDHGAWSVLRHLYPQADVPVVQLSLDVNLSESAHVALAKKLAPLRNEGVLILASGNIVHNLRLLNWTDDAPVPEWAKDFDQAVEKAVGENNIDRLIHWNKLTPAADYAHPSPDHYWPFLYAIALRNSEDRISYPITGFQNSTISMRGVLISSNG